MYRIEKATVSVYFTIGSGMRISERDNIMMPKNGNAKLEICDLSWDRRVVANEQLSPKAQKKRSVRCSPNERDHVCLRLW